MITSIDIIKSVRIGGDGKLKQARPGQADSWFLCQIQRDEDGIETTDVIIIRDSINGPKAYTLTRNPALSRIVELLFFASAMVIYTSIGTGVYALITQHPWLGYLGGILFILCLIMIIFTGTHLVPKTLIGNIRKNYTQLRIYKQYKSPNLVRIKRATQEVKFKRATQEVKFAPKRLLEL